MKVLRLTEPGRFESIELPRPGDPGPGQVLARILRVGVCGTDLHAYQGRQTFFTYPRVLGHELAVEVEAIGDGVKNLKKGAQYCVEPFINCGACRTCRLGKTNCCEKMQTLGVHVDGGMCEWMHLPAAKLHDAPGLSVEQMATVEPLCIGAHAVWRAAPEARDSALVIGAGPIGLAVIESLKGETENVAVAELSKFRQNFLKEHEAWTRTDDGQERFSIVFDCTGSAKCMSAAFERVAHGGKLVFVGHQPGDISFSNPLFHGREMTLYASRNATADDFQRVIGKLASGQIDSRSWLAGVTGPAEFAPNFPAWLDPESGVIKPMLTWE
jgi:threonine dehydrogenase-like Zn-dependent dehydrogenase